MKRLTLIRHAKSDWQTGVRDFERPLNRRGKKTAPLMGQRLAEQGCRPELIISSPAERARQTAERIARELGYPEAQIEWTEEIYEATPQTLIKLLRSLPEELDEVLLVGHNPGLSELGQWLSVAAPEWLPTCGLLELELDCDRWTEAEKGCGRLLRYDYPKKPH